MYDVYNLQMTPIYIETSLLRRLQAQTLPDATPPMGKSHPFSKMTVTFEPLMGSLERKQVNGSRLLTRDLPMQEPPGQPALTLEEREAKGGVGELVNQCI